MYGEEVRCVEPVRELAPKKRGGLFARARKDEDVVVSVGKYHVWVHTRETPKKRPSELAELHILALSAITHDAHNARLTLAPVGGPHKGSSLDFVCAPDSALFSCLVDSYRALTYGAVGGGPVALRSTTPLPVSPEPQSSIAPFDEVVSNYYGQCSLMRVAPCPELLYYLSSLYASGSHELDLTAVPVIGAAGVGAAVAAASADAAEAYPGGPPTASATTQATASAASSAAAAE